MFQNRANVTFQLCNSPPGAGTVCLSVCQAQDKTWAASLFFPLGDKFRDFTASPSLCSLLQLFLDSLVWLLLLSGQSCSANDHFPVCLLSVNILQNTTSASRSSGEQQRKRGSCSEPGRSRSNGKGDSQIRNLAARFQCLGLLEQSMGEEIKKRWKK